MKPYLILLLAALLFHSPGLSQEEPSPASAHIIGGLADGTSPPPEPPNPGFTPAPNEILSSEAFEKYRETARLAQEADLKANPPKPADLILNFWDGQISTPTEKANAP